LTISENFESFDEQRAELEVKLMEVEQHWLALFDGLVHLAMVFDALLKRI